MRTRTITREPIPPGGIYYRPWSRWTYRRPDFPSPLASRFLSEIIDAAHGPGPCTHSKFYLHSGFHCISTSPDGKNEQWGDSADDVRSSVAMFMNSFKPVDNQIGGLLAARLRELSVNAFQFIFELPETILGILRPWEYFSYGGYQWSWKPLLNDFVSSLQLIEAFSNNMDLLEGKKIRETFSFQQPLSCTVPEGTFTCMLNHKVTLNGEVQLLGYEQLGKQARAYLVLLETLGLGRNILSNIWAVLPLSFVVDWFIPVGDFLTSIVSNDWFGTIHFDGWRCDYMSIDSLPTISTGSIGPFRGFGDGSYKYFSRIHLSSGFHTENTVAYTPPNLSNLFSTLYIFADTSKYEPKALITLGKH